MVNPIAKGKGTTAATPRPPRSSDPANVLVVSPFAENRSVPCGVLGTAKWTVFAVENRQEALSLVQRTEIAIVICERDLPDGDWVALFEKLVEMPRPPAFIVCSHLADEQLWAEALNRGAYDVLAVPFEANELQRVVFLARQTWQRDWELRNTVRRAASPEVPLSPNTMVAGVAG